MSKPVRCNDMGPIIDTTASSAIQNDLAKGYANMPSLVPEKYFFLLAVDMISQALRLHIGDQFGELIFIAAIYHPSDIGGLPTGLLCLGTVEFQTWLFPTANQISIPPKLNEFCFAETQEFIHGNATIDQLRSDNFLDKATLKNTVIIIHKFFASLKVEVNDGYRLQCLGIRQIQQPRADDSSKKELSEAEKNALDPANDVVRRALRLAVKNVNAVSSKVPVGAINVTLTSSTGKQTGGRTAATNSNKKSKEDNGVIDLRSPQQKAADTRVANKAAQEAKIKESVKKQLDQMQKQQSLQLPIVPSQLHNAQPPQMISQLATVQHATPNAKTTTKADQRSEMALDFKMLESAVTSFENFHDRRMEKFLSTTK
jgi:hypothetical protein